MRVKVPGHVYELCQLDDHGSTLLRFVKRADANPGEDTFAGVNNQEVLRALIDRVEFLESQKHALENESILHHLRMALVLHESRALRRKAEDGKILPEMVETGIDGHYKLLEVKKK